MKVIRVHTFYNIKNNNFLWWGQNKGVSSETGNM